MKKHNKVLMSLMFIPLLFSCSPKETYTPVIVGTEAGDMIVSTDDILVVPFNTYMSMKYFKNSTESKDKDFDKNLNKLYVDKVTDLHTKLDRHHFYKDETTNEIITNVKTINESYGTGEEIVCSTELYELLKLGHELTLTTNGKFNFYMGSLTTLWDYVLEAGGEDITNVELFDPLYNPNTKQEIENNVKALVTIDEVKNLMTFNDEKKSVIFNSVEDKDGLDRDTNSSKYRPQITSGGIAKGYATEKLKRMLLEKGYTRGFLSSGGSTITTLSDDLFAVSKEQNVSITDPRSPSIMGNDTIAKIKLTKEYALSTSGTNTFEKSYFVKVPNNDTMVKRHHIINPETGEPSLYHASVTLVSNTFDNGELDALSTAFVNMSTQEGIAFRETLLEKYENHDLSIVFVDSEDGVKLDYTIVGEIKDDVTILSYGG